jgi:hypothetical protein
MILFFYLSFSDFKVSGVYQYKSAGAPSPDLLLSTSSLGGV